jgi:cytochrome c-type biogenesis protein
LRRGLVLLGAYSLGLAIPFLIAAVAVERFIGAFQRYRSKLIWVDRFAGVLLIIVGVLMMTNYMTVLTGYLQGLTPAALKSRL